MNEQVAIKIEDPGSLSELIEPCVHVGVLSKLKPTVNFASRRSASPNQQWGPRRIPDCQLIYVMDGEAQLTIGNRIYQLSTGDCAFYGTNSPHLMISSDTNPITFYSLHFNWDAESPEPVHPSDQITNCSRAELSNSCCSYKLYVDGYGDVTIPHFFTSAGLENTLSNMVREYQVEGHGYAASLRGMMMQLIVELVRNLINRENALKSQKIASAIAAIEKEPNINWTPALLAELCNYHPSYFSALFKEVIGQSPKHFLIMERIRKAKQLLVHAETVHSVAEQLGYTSVHYFCRNFKTVTGLTPTEYKQRRLEI